jgi:hypothetical protein
MQGALSVIQILLDLPFSVYLVHHHDQNAGFRTRTETHPLGTHQKRKAFCSSTLERSSQLYQTWDVGWPMFITTPSSALISARVGGDQSVILALFVGSMLCIFFLFPFSVVSCTVSFYKPI